MGFTIALEGASKTLTLKASSVEDAFMKVKANYLKPKPVLSQDVLINDSSAMEFKWHPKEAKGEVSSEALVKCMDTARSEWKRVREAAVSNVLKVEGILDLVKRNHQTKERVINALYLVKVAIEPWDNGPIVNYQFQWDEDVLAGCMVGVNYCPYGTYTSSASVDLDDIYETFG